jgi:phage terminase large subunit GpA-like protein
MHPIEGWMQAGRQALAQSIRDALRPDARIWVDEWAEAHRVLPEDTPEPGPFRNHRTPYLVDIQRTMSPASPWREGWWMKPHQAGGSVSGENMIGAWVCTAAGSMLVVFPTLDDARQWELARFEPLRKGTAALRRRILASHAKGADNTKLRKKYPGGVMRLIGANRVGAMKSSTIRYIKFEEPDEYPRALDGQGSIIEVLKGRTSNFGRKAKIYGDGTPTVDDHSEIQRQVARGDCRVWHLHCPDCGHAQPLAFERLKWPDGDPASALYHCIGCGIGNDEQAWKARNYRPRPAGMTEPEAKASGRAYWEATAVGEPGVASWLGLEALALPVGWRPWPALAAMWTAAQADEEALKVFFNNMRGLPYKDKLRTDVGSQQLQQRAEGYDLMTCPMGGLVVVAGVDTQDNRLAVVVRAFGRGEESWGIWHGEIYGDPSAPATWSKLRELLDAPIRHASGQVIRVDVAAIDAGGHHGEDVYAFTRDAQLRGRQWFAIRGAKSYDAPKLGRPKKVDFTWRGAPVPGGAELRFVGTQSIKNLIDGRLKLGKPGGGYYHFPLGFGADYFEQLRSEKREWRRDMQGHKALWWVKGTARNEAWDCEVYLYAAFLFAMSGRHAEAVWAAREKVYGRVRQLDLLDDQPPAADVVQTAEQTADQQSSETDQPAPADAPGQAELLPQPTPDPVAAALVQRTKTAGHPPRKKRGWVNGWR